MDALGEALVSAIIGSAQDSEDGLAGYALVTDADMMGVHGVSASRQFIEDEGDESLLFMPVDWATEHHTANFKLASDRLAVMSSHDAQSYDERVRTVTQSFVSALRDARFQHPALADAVMLVICADGDGVWRQLEERAVRDLNDADTCERWISTVRGSD